MTIDDIGSSLGSHAQDIIKHIITELGSPGLTEKQIHMVLLASVYTTGDILLIESIEVELKGLLSDVEINEIKSSVSMMTMNNVYYRFVHLASDKEYVRMPTNLSMDVIENPGVYKVDFELACLAVSAINGCKMCIDAHLSKVTKEGVSKVGIQSVIRIAAVINAVAKALRI